MSQPVAADLRQEKPQNSAAFKAMSQLSQMSQGTNSESRQFEPLNEERAAIVEHDAGIPRAWAEGYARLHPDRPPTGVPLRRWQAVIEAIGAFLHRWPAEAATLGWEPCDIFGADATRPEVTWLNAGPLWSGNGASVVEVHPDHIVLETRGGARQTHYRRPHLRPRALPWELVSDHGG